MGIPPPANNGLITIKQDGRSEQKFRVDQGNDTTINLSDTNTTYTPGNGLNLGGTTFSVKPYTNYDVFVDGNGVGVTSNNNHGALANANNKIVKADNAGKIMAGGYRIDMLPELT